jgi:hypothetical protein
MKKTKTILWLVGGIAVVGFFGYDSYKNASSSVKTVSVKQSDFDSKMNKWKEALNSDDLDVLNEASREMWKLDEPEYTKASDLKHAIDSKIQSIKEANTPPVAIVSSYISHNSIGTPELNVTVQNTGDKEIDAFKIQAICYNSFGEKTGNNSGVFNGIAQNKTIKPNNGSNMYSPFTWNLALYENTTKADVTITEVHFTDGTTWIHK